MVGYFDKAAANYESASSSWPWSWLRKREAAGIFTLLGDVSGKTVLELGTGAGYYTRRLLKHGVLRVVAVDASENMVAALGRDSKIEAVLSDAETLNLSERFSYILCAGLLEFVTNPESVLVTAKQHADEDSKLVLLVPRVNFWGSLYWLFHRTHGMRIHLFRANELKVLAEKTGWTVIDELNIWPFTYELSLRAKP